MKTDRLTGKLVISLDFELYWGVRDHRTIQSYRDNLDGVRAAIPAMLKLFEKYGVHATWATVGFLFHNSASEIFSDLPQSLPHYQNTSLNPYPYASEKIDPELASFHFAPELIAMIGSSAFQEIGTHTYSHFYCLEEGQDERAFQADLNKAKQVAKKVGIAVESLVFPRNQYNESYLQVCQAAGIKAYRGNQDSWIYSPRAGDQESRLRRAIRLIDSYFNITGHHGHKLETTLEHGTPVNIPASRFLRPYSQRLRWLEGLRAKRIKSDLDHCAKKGLAYHLWWHPHNFGVNLHQNLGILEAILKHFSSLRDQGAMESLSMGELAAKAKRLTDQTRSA